MKNLLKCQHLIQLDDGTSWFAWINICSCGYLKPIRVHLELRPSRSTATTHRHSYYTQRTTRYSIYVYVPYMWQWFNFRRICKSLKDLSHRFHVTNRNQIYNEISRDYVNIVHIEAVWTF